MGHTLIPVQKAMMQRKKDGRNKRPIGGIAIRLPSFIAMATAEVTASRGTLLGLDLLG
ncbi:MAG: hypothetical protein ACXWCG_13435 [Flavitalea sp.]